MPYNTTEKAREYGKLGGRRGGALSAVRKMELAQKKVMEKMIYKKTAPLIRAGMIPAMGQHFVYRIDEERDSKGKLLSRKHILVENPKEIAQALDQIEEGGIHPDDKFYYVTAKEPDVRAIEMLLNRGYGKPKESLTIDGEVKFSLKALAVHRKDIKDEPLEIENKEVSAVSETIISPKAKKK